MIKINSSKQIDKYLSSISRNKNFMLNSLEEESNYIKHNKDRFIEVLSIIDSATSKIKGKFKLLDIGTSPLTFILKNRYGNKIDLYTIDYSPKFEKLCISKNINFKKVNLETEDIRYPNNFFDIVTFCEVIEHIHQKHHKKILNKISNKLKKGGYCLLQTPNKFSPKAIVSKIIGLDKWVNMSNAPKVGKEFIHKKEYGFEELRELILSINDFSITKSKLTRYYDTFLSAMVYRKSKNIFKYLVLANYKLISLVPSLRRGMQFLIKKK